MKSDPAARPVGRPRSQDARRAILDATIRLLETAGERDLAIEHIAKESGVGKPTIYRWWPSKTAVVIDAFLELISPPLIYPTNGTGRDALVAQLHRDVKIWNSRSGRIIAEILAAGQEDAAVLESFRKNYIEIRRIQARTAIAKGKSSGEVSPDVDPEIAIDLICGAIFLRLMVQHLPIDNAFMDGLVDLAFRGLTPRGRTIHTKRL